MKSLEKYNMSVDRIEEVDLREVYMQGRPNDPLDECISIDGSPEVRYLMMYSPHTSIARLFYDAGEDWLGKFWKETNYFCMMKKMGKKEFPKKVVSLCKSIREGYCRKGYEDDMIVLLDTPFARTRYNRDVPNLVPEMWSGHHRAGCLIALGQYKVKVAFAKDDTPGVKHTDGKIHHLCVEG